MYATVEPESAHFADAFLEISNRLLRAEDEESVIRMSSIFCLTIHSISTGEDTLATANLTRMLRTATELRLLGDAAATPEELGLFDPDYISAFACAAWGAYNFCWQVLT